MIDVMTSPIEIQLLDAIRTNLPADMCLFDYTATAAVAIRRDDEPWSITSDVDGYDAPSYNNRPDVSRHCSLFAQVRIESYRIDLVLVGGSSSLILIECDGHDFHERTKQQAIYDRERDRVFLAMGIVTARFTGSEIFNYPEKCVDELFAIERTSGRINTALLRNGFHTDGRSFRHVPSAARVKRTDGSEYEGHWNPGRSG